VSVVHHLLQNGWKTPRLNGQPLAPSTLACAHLARERIFYQVLKASRGYYELWYMSEDKKSYSTSPPQGVLDDMITGPHKFLRFRQIALDLDAQRRRGCGSCVHEYPEPPTQKDDNTFRLHSPNRILNTVNAPRNGSTNYLTDPSGSRSARTQTHAIPLSRSDDCQTPSNDESDVDECNFDDYDGAPIQREQHTASGNTWSFDGYGNFMLETCWSTWVDRGYRLKPRFFSMFPDKRPAQHVEHLLPTSSAGLTTDDNPHHTTNTSELSTSSSSWVSDSEVSLSDNPVDIQISMPIAPDSVLGLQGMLDEAGNVENTTISQEVFVCGRDRAGEFFRVDPILDEIKVSPEDTYISPDLDSFIYVTHRLKFRGAMHLHLLPLSIGRAPFWKTNHVEVKVLCPPEGVGLRGRVTKTYTLNQIPHTHFGQLGAGAVQFNVYVFYPRMIQKHPARKFMLNMVPLPVQDLWLSSGVIPAVREVFGHDFHGTTEYVPWSLEQLRLKKGHDRSQKTLAISPQCLSRLQDVLRSRIRRYPDLLGRYGSFFFVVDSRGIKLLSKQYPLHKQPQVVVQDMLPFLDLGHMMDRKHGELILDLGISYHPGPNQIPMIGLWKLSAVDSSYRAMGTNKGHIHHACTLDEYGGRQARMKKQRRIHTQLLSRSTYNLVFEVIRTGGQGQYLCSDKDAIRCGEKYMEACHAWKVLFQQAGYQAFGVREEVRGSAAAIFDMFPAASVKVSYTD
jgi:hypothetical protein